MTTYPITPQLLVLDMQPGFLAAIPDSDELQWRCSFTLEAAKGLGLPVLFTEQVPDKLGGTLEDLLAMVDEPVTMGKGAFSAFGDKKISSYLRSTGLKNLLICGIETPVCVYQTAMDALRLNFKVTVLADCVGARRAADAATVLAQLAHAGCSILPAETIFYGLLHEARHPFFRPYTALVKKYS